MKDGDIQALAYALHGFVQEHPDWPHSSVRPWTQPHNCWPCWNGADHIARVLDGMAITFTWNPEPVADAINGVFRGGCGREGGTVTNGHRHQSSRRRE